MSFLEIKDPKKRDLTVNEFLQTKKNIQDNDRSKRLGDISDYREYAKMFKPITQSQKEVKESLLEELKPMRENLKQLPAAVTFPQLQAIAAPPEDEDEDEDEDVMRVGKIAHRYLSEYATKQNVDKTFGIYKNPIHKMYYIGDKPIDINGDNLVIDDKEYEGTSGLWELIVSKNPDEKKYSDEDYNNYAKIMVKTNAMKHNNDPTSTKPKSSRSSKWRHLLKNIWQNRDKYEGEGIGGSTKTKFNKGIKDTTIFKPIAETVVIPSDPDALSDRLELLLAEMTAGNTGVRNELVSICDELLRQNEMSTASYKKLMLYIKNNA